MKTKAELSKMSEADLTRLAASEFGIEFEPSMIKSQMVAAILTQQSTGSIDVVEDSEELEPIEAETPKPPKLKYYKIRISNPSEGESKFVDVHISNEVIQRSWRIRRGVDVVVPEYVITVLDSCVTTRLERVESSPGVWALEDVHNSRFPYSNFGEVPAP